MSDEQPTQIGHYTVSRELGRGGMGVVYLARDARLDRDVAIKALPAELAADPARLERFEREAKTLAQLHHENIAAIYGVEVQDGARYLVLEFVEGETLADRLDRGPLPVDDALEFAGQIASGIEAAHDAGVIHRDLKPGNVILTPEGRAKVLDFGLARSDDGMSSSGNGLDSPTMTSPVMNSPTIAGAILGTAPYMSPEQARGRRVDKRTDIWSFGVVLYEMLTGIGPFHGETATDSIGAILHKNVDLSRLPAGTPAQVRRVLKRCLARDKNERYRDIGDAALDLRAVEPTAEPVSSSSRGVGVLLGIFGLLVGALAMWFVTCSLVTGPSEPAPVVRFDIHLEQDGRLSRMMGPNFALSPDGRSLAYCLDVAETRTLYVRDLDTERATVLTSGNVIEDPFFSPDGNWVAYYNGTSLMKIAVHGGSPFEICESGGDMSRGGVWLTDGTIVFAPDTTSPLMRVSASGGEPTPVTTLVSDQNERSHRWPASVPGQDDLIVFTSQTRDQSFYESSIEIVDLANGTRSVLYQGGAFPRVTPAGVLLFARDGTLFGVQLTQDYRSSIGEAVPIASGLYTNSANGGAHYSIADNGTFLYAEGRGGDITTSQPRWVSLADGTTEAVSGIVPGEYFFPKVSPDGKRFLSQGALLNSRVMVHEFRRSVSTPVTSDEFGSIYPIWSPDGQQIAFAADSRDQVVPSLHVTSLGSDEPPRRLLTADAREHAPLSWSPDGLTSFCTRRRAATGASASTRTISRPARAESISPLAPG